MCPIPKPPAGAQVTVQERQQPNLCCTRCTPGRSGAGVRREHGGKEGRKGCLEPRCTELGWAGLDSRVRLPAHLLPAPSLCKLLPGQPRERRRCSHFEGCSSPVPSPQRAAQPAGHGGSCAGQTHPRAPPRSAPSHPSSPPFPIPAALGASLPRKSSLPLRSLPAPQAKQYATASPRSRPVLKNKLINLPGATKTLSSWPLDVCGRSSRWRLKELKVCFEKLFDSGRGSGAKRQRWGCECLSPSAPAWVREQQQAGGGKGKLSASQLGRGS